MRSPPERTRAGVRARFGITLRNEPRLVDVTLWRPDLLPRRPSRPRGRSLIYGGVAKKP